MADVTPMPSIALDKRGLPVKHWSGRTKAAQFLREWVHEHTNGYVTENEATDLTEEVIRAYLKEQR